MIETSRGGSEGAVLSSSLQNGTRADGRCIVFQYAINGPNSEQLSLFMQPIELQGSNDTLTTTTTGKPKNTLWQSRGAVQQEWHTAAVLYSFGQPHQVLNNWPKSNDNPTMNESTVSISSIFIHFFIHFLIHFLKSISIVVADCS